jgi:multicomponent Na+:H+ antiporter subunit F
LADFFLFVAAILIFFGIVLGVLRLILGRTTVDRVAAVDMLTVISIDGSSISMWLWSTAC